MAKAERCLCGKSVASASLVLILLSACGSSGENSSDVDIRVNSGASETIGAAGESSTSLLTESAGTTTTTSLVPVRNTLAGVWRAKAQDILAANLANLGGMPMMCDGVIVLNLSADGSFSREGSMMCTIDGVMMNGQIVNSSGTWDATANTLSVTVTKNDGYAEVSGGPGGKVTRVALPDNGFSEADYTVNATTLTINFTDPSVGTVSQVYTRG